ncbi:hypothetical protein dsx2_1253 [Desulfovibrio sp. X2]|uniref:hypothetical protein n=1 Tax=Desulfovibrio sp. X2 TaxID=941449 RepID=UPI000358C9BC|nr:hypothetical protein [Desulfovibrio sp. X2]EPR36336.1 hypothetical protein dsx2_1253 [Desulfovibrio sp. X2]
MHPPKRLKDIFDACAWTAKTLGELPERPDEILYAWREDEADTAALFFGPSGARMLTEHHPAVKRSLYLGRDASGCWVLAVREAEHEGFDVRRVAEETARMLDATRLNEYWQRRFGGGRADGGKDAGENGESTGTAGKK